MEQFASGWKRNYYGKAGVSVYRLRRDGNIAAGESPVFGANIKLLVYGDAFWPTYTVGDNTGLIATDSMKNFIQREALNYAGQDLEDCCRFFGTKFLETYPQVEGIQVSAVEIPYAGLAGDRVSFAPSGPERATARLELSRTGTPSNMVEIAKVFVHVANPMPTAASGGVVMNCASRQPSRPPSQIVFVGWYGLGCVMKLSRMSI